MNTKFLHLRNDVFREKRVVFEVGSWGETDSLQATAKKALDNQEPEYSDSNKSPDNQAFAGENPFSDVWEKGIENPEELKEALKKVPKNKLVNDKEALEEKLTNATEEEKVAKNDAIETAQRLEDSSEQLKRESGGEQPLNNSEILADDKNATPNTIATDIGQNPEDANNQKSASHKATVSKQISHPIAGGIQSTASGETITYSATKETKSA